MSWICCQKSIWRQGRSSSKDLIEVRVLLLSSLEFIYIYIYIFIFVVKFVDAEFQLLAQGYPRNTVAVLICLALNGFHGVVKYLWEKDGKELPDDLYPVIYTEASGRYQCSVTGLDGKLHETEAFEVKC